jgi:hypothetical protein
MSCRLPYQLAQDRHARNRRRPESPYAFPATARSGSEETTARCAPAWVHRVVTGSVSLRSTPRIALNGARLGPIIRQTQLDSNQVYGTFSPTGYCPRNSALSPYCTRSMRSGTVSSNDARNGHKMPPRAIRSGTWMARNSRLGPALEPFALAAPA